VYVCKFMHVLCVCACVYLLDGQHVLSTAGKHYLLFFVVSFHIHPIQRYIILCSSHELPDPNSNPKP